MKSPCCGLWKGVQSSDPAKKGKTRYKKQDCMQRKTERSVMIAGTMVDLSFVNGYNLGCNIRLVSQEVA